MRRLADQISNDMDRSELEAMIVERSINDATFRDLLIKNPKQALQQFFQSANPPPFNIEVKAENAKTYYHVVSHLERTEIGVGPEALYPRRNFRAQVNALLHTDPTFKSKFVSQPKGAVSEQFNFHLPQGLDVKVLEETANKIYIILPHAPHEAVFNSPFALQFFGQTGAVWIPASNSLKSVTHTLTVEAWIKASSFSQGNWQDAVVSHHENGCGWELRVGQGIPRFMVTVGGVHYYAQPTGDIPLLTPGKWHYIAGVYTGAALELYLDGTYQYGTPLSGTIDIATGPMALGRNSNRAWDKREFMGELDDVRIWGAALNKYIISAHRPRKRPVERNTAQDHNLIAYYSMSEGTGSVLYDHSSNNNNGSIEGDAKWTSTNVDSAPRVTDYTLYA